MVTRDGMKQVRLQSSSLRMVAIEVSKILAIMALAAAGTRLSAWALVAWVSYLLGPVTITVYGIVLVVCHIRAHSARAAIVILIAMLASLYLSTILSEFPGS